MKLSERKKFRGFWPTSKGFGGKSKSKGKGKSFSKSPFGGGKSSLLDRISKLTASFAVNEAIGRPNAPIATKKVPTSSLAVPSTVT